MATILFCEDDAYIQKLIVVALRSSPHALLLARDGEEGLEIARRERPRVIFTDLSMPRMDGYALCRAVRADEALRDTPVIVLTASAQRGELEQAREHGASDVLLKPFTMEALREAVDRWSGPATG